MPLFFWWLIRLFHNKMKDLHERLPDMSDWFETHKASIQNDAPSNYDSSNPVYETSCGAMYLGQSEVVLRADPVKNFSGKFQLVMTSPPFPLDLPRDFSSICD